MCLDLGDYDTRWHSMKMGDIFHTNGAVRKEEWSNNGDRNNRVYGMLIFLIWNFRFRTLISLFIQVFDCYLATNSAGKVACKYPFIVVVTNKLLTTSFFPVAVKGDLHLLPLFDLCLM